MRDLLLRIQALVREVLGVVSGFGFGLSSIGLAVNRIAKRLEYLIELIEHPEPGMSLVAGVVFNVQTGAIIMAVAKDQTPIALTNAANPANATRFLGVVDVLNPSNPPVLPSITSSDPSKLAIVTATALNGNNQLVFGAYPVDTNAETNDEVDVAITLAGQPDIDLVFQISGTPVPPPETDSLDPGSAVGAWTGAPNVPTVPT